MKGKSLVEVFSVFILFRIVGFWMRTTGFFKWELNTLGWSYLGGLLLIVVPVFIVLVTKRDFFVYGLSLANWKENLDIGLTCALVSGALVNGVGFMYIWTHNISYTDMTGALILTGCHVAVLFLILLILNRRNYSNPPNPLLNVLILIILLLLPIVTGLYFRALTSIVVSTVVWQFIFSGFGEEIMYRGYYQSRINEEFGRPFTFLGVNFGIGVFISALLFALIHMLNPFSPFTREYELAWWWGLFTFAAGVTLGMVREKTGSIIPCGIAHGLPDAVGEAFALLFS